MMPPIRKSNVKGVKIRVFNDLTPCVKKRGGETVR
jgi:hypothetical protein